MFLSNIFKIAGSGMFAQSVRLSTIASNDANVNSVSGDPKTAYHARYPVFAPAFDANGSSAGVRVLGIFKSQDSPPARYEPSNPLADPKGYVYGSNVNPVDELVDMISASRSMQNLIEVMNTTKQLMVKTLNIGK